MMGIRIVIGEGEPLSQALNRLKKVMERNGVTREMRRQTCYVDPTQLRRKKQFRKRFRARRATLTAQMAGEQPVASLEDASERFSERSGKP
jgi:ribosomal protein S21